MKELKNQPQLKTKELKKILILDIINSIKQGKRPSQISKEFNVSLQRINYHLAILKSKGIVKKIGYGVWEVDTIGELKNFSQATNPSSNIRGHAFIWKVRFNKFNKFNWKQLLINKQIEFKEKGITKTPSILIDNKIVWLGQKNIIIYEPNSYFGANAIESRKFAVIELINTLNILIKTLGLNISSKDITFTPRREHYSLIKNLLAIQCNKNNEKINVYNEKGLWLSIDNSFNLGELETLGTINNQPLETNLKVQKWWNENKDTNFEVSAKYVLHGLNTLTQNQLNQTQQLEAFAIALNRHIPAYEGMANQVEELNKTIAELKEQIKLMNMKGGENDRTTNIN